jgi:signal peptidase I
MSKQITAQRNIVGMAIITLILGAVPLMLWMGRARLALVYMCVGLTCLATFFIAVAHGLFPIGLFNGWDLTWVIQTLRVPFLLIALYHAFRLNKQPLNSRWYSKWYIALTLPLLAAFFLTVSVRTFLFQPFNSPSASNAPSLVVGDYFYVDKRAYAGSDPQRGDMTVFKHPKQPEFDYVKRVIGIPGDRIQMRGGVPYLNGSAILREPVMLDAAFVQSQGVSEGTQFFRETLPNGRSYVIAEFPQENAFDNTEEYVVPDGHYFTLGDSRDNSLDSRFLDQMGYVPRANFIGPYSFRFWNSAGVSLNNRPIETWSSNAPP